MNNHNLALFTFKGVTFYKSMCLSNVKGAMKSQLIIDCMSVRKSDIILIFYPGLIFTLLKAFTSSFLNSDSSSPSNIF